MIAPATVPGVLRTGIHSARPAATDVAVGTIYACSTHGTIDQSDGATWSTYYNSNLAGSKAAVEVQLGGTTLTTGSKGFWEVPYACTITANRLFANASGSLVVDVKKATYSGFPTTSSICASAKPTLSSAQKSQDSTLSGWTTALAAGDVLEFNVDSVTTIVRATLSLTVTRT